MPRVTLPYPHLTEEVIMRDDRMCHIKGWRRYRIEYGFECGCPEGAVYLPADADADQLEATLREICKKR